MNDELPTNRRGVLCAGARETFPQATGDACTALGVWGMVGQPADVHAVCVATSARVRDLQETHNGRPTEKPFSVSAGQDDARRCARGTTMQIQEFCDESGRVKYDLLNDNGGFVGRFYGMDDAAAAARYISGANMGDDERQRAIDAMRDANVARVFGKRMNAAKQKRRVARGGC